MVTDQTGSDLPGEVVQPPTGVIHPWGVGFVSNRHLNADPDEFFSRLDRVHNTVVAAL